MYKAILFDLDGTLLNTLDDLADSTNAALAAGGYPTRSLEEVRSFLGNGIGNLIRLAMPEGSTPAETEATLERFRRHYALHNRCKTCPYPGILPMLENLSRTGVPLCVLSNKNDPNVQALCRDFFPGLITLAAGEKPGVARKPDPAGVWWLCSQLAVQPSEAILVGDSEVDAETARNAGVDFLAVGWGFRTENQLLAAGADKVWQTVADVEKHLLQSCIPG